jgi:hypothetical protein
MRSWIIAALACALAAAPALAVNNVHVPKNKKARAKNPAKPPHLTYYGGRVISNVKIVAVWWGSGVTQEVQTRLPEFYADFTASPMFDWLSEYDTTATALQADGITVKGTGQHIGKGSFIRAAAITPKATGNPITDEQIQAELTAQIKAKALPAPDHDTLYMFHFAPGQKIKQGKSVSCADFCAYHGTTKDNVFYGVMPDEGPGSTCEKGCGNADPIGNTTASAAHEIFEAVTDAQVGLIKGNAVRAPMAWYDSHRDASGSEYAEIGDICSDYEAPLKTAGRTWTVQKMWSNKANGCIVLAGDAPQTVPLVASASKNKLHSDPDDKGGTVKPASAKKPRKAPAR